MTNNVKSLTIYIDDLSEENVFQLPISHINLKTGLWQMCVNEIGYQNMSTTPISEFSQLQCNLIKDTRILNFSKQVYLPSIASLLIKSVPEEKKIVYLQKNWFIINNIDDILRINFVEPKSEMQIRLKCKIFVTFLLRRIN
jgi:hypothetical protein